MIDAYWYGDFDSPGACQIDMEDKIYPIRSVNDLNKNEDDRGYVFINLDSSIEGKIWVMMLYRYDIGEVIMYSDNREKLISSFVDSMFDAIVESVLDNDNENIPDFEDKEEYQDYLKKHNLEMCFNRETLILYLREHGYLVLDIKGHLIPAVITLKQVTIM